MIYHFLSIIVFIGCYSVSANATIQQQTQKFFLQEDSLTSSLNRVSIETLENKLDLSIQNEDTATQITALIQIGDYCRFKGDYDRSFQSLWKAMRLSECPSLRIKKVQINRNLGILYEIYNRDSLAYHYYNTSLEQAKKAIQSKHKQTSFLASSYYSLASLSNKQNEYDRALCYLDSCELVKGSNKGHSFVYAERGNILTKQEKYVEARQFLQKAMDTIDKNKNHYNYKSIVLMYIADLHQSCGSKDSALYYYEASLKQMNKIDAYKEFKPILLQNLSEIYYKNGFAKKAYQYIAASKSISDSLFNISFEKNCALFEIKNNYEVTIDKKNIVIDQKTSEIKKQNNKVFYLLTSLAILMLAGVSGIVFLLFRSKMKKLKINQAEENKKAKEMVESKNRELTSYALRLVEKDKSVEELLEVIKSNSNGDYQTMKAKHTKMNGNLWENFNLRFTEINSSFYENLLKKYPKLTATEQKHCALVKLNLDCNEMAKILNISIQSVHTSRYRIRKKLDLPHDEQLSRHIANIN